MNRNLPRISNILSGKMRGKVVTPYSLYDKQFQNNQDDFNREVSAQYAKYMKLNRMDKSVVHLFPKSYKRLIERQAPSLVKRQKREDQMRAKDRNDVLHLCQWFMWNTSAHKPSTRPKRK